MTRYADFDTLRKLTEMTATDHGYSKFIQTGRLELHDYNTGFLDVEIYTITNTLDEHSVRIWFGTIDDGDFGGWRSASSKEKADRIVKEIAENIFKDMISLPSTDELNKMLQRYEITVGHE